MSKRFTDSEKWKKKWFRSLNSDEKVFWFYLIDNCNLAGIWEVDFELASMFCGKLNESEIRERFSKQYTEICEGRHWLINDFILFQYGQLRETNPMHRGVLAVLRTYGVHEGAYIPLRSPLEGAQVKDKVKDKDICKGIVKGILSDEDIKTLWAAYPRKIGHKEAVRHIRATIITGQDLSDCAKAIENYKKEIERLKTEEKYIKHGDTFFNNWRDYVNIKQPERIYYTTDGNVIR